MRSRHIGLSLGFLLSLVTCVQAQSLDTPLPGSFVSGLGYVRGWKCSGGPFTYTIDDSAPVPLSYGGERGDTLGPCGDTNNGFITQQNWGLLPTGQHTIRVYDNGVLFAQATFTVTNLGTEFLSGASSSCSTTLAGKDVTLQWQEGQQSYVVTSVSGGGGGSGLTDLSSLIGGWLFTYKIISTFSNTYTLTNLTTVSGTPTLVGTGDFGGQVIANKVQDLSSGSPLPYTFALLDPGIIICRFFVFNLDTLNSVSGRYVQFDTDASGACTSSSSGNTYAMTGVSTSAAMVTQLQADQQMLEQQAKDEDLLLHLEKSQDLLIHPEAAGDNLLPVLTDLMLKAQQSMGH